MDNVNNIFNLKNGEFIVKMKNYNQKLISSQILCSTGSNCILSGFENGEIKLYALMHLNKIKLNSKFNNYVFHGPNIQYDKDEDKFSNEDEINDNENDKDDNNSIDNIEPEDINEINSQIITKKVNFDEDIIEKEIRQNDGQNIVQENTKNEIKKKVKLNFVEKLKNK